MCIECLNEIERLKPYRTIACQDNIYALVTVVKRCFNWFAVFQLKLMQRMLTIEQLSRHLGFHSSLSYDDKIALSKEYMKHHRDGLVYGEYMLKL